MLALLKCVAMANFRSDDVSWSQQTAQRLSEVRHFELRYINEERLAKDHNLLTYETAWTSEVRARREALFGLRESLLLVQEEGRGHTIEKGSTVHLALWPDARISAGCDVRGSDVTARHKYLYLHGLILNQFWFDLKYYNFKHHISLRFKYPLYILGERKFWRKTTTLFQCPVVRKCYSI